MILFATLAWTLAHGALGPWPRGVGIAIAAVGALALAFSAWPRAAERLAGRLLPGMVPGFAARLGAQLVVAGVLFGVPAWFAFDAMKDTLLEDPGLLEKTRLSGGLLGYIALALGGVGLGVRRDLRESFARLGLGPLALRHIGIIIAGALALFALNAGGEQIQHRFFPALWKADHEVTRLIARALSPGRIVLIGLTAGIGEEITLRGGLQPRLGIALTSLLFAALHVQYSWFGMLLVFTLGVTLGIIRRRANTTAAIVVHGLYDMLALVTS
jgi:membrane protease YdiL (CAAX protease family)